MSANSDIPAPSLRVTTRACPDGQWPSGIDSDTSISAMWTQGEAPHRTGFIAWGEALRIETAGAERFTQARAHLSQLVASSDIDDDVHHPGSGLVAFGSFTFDSTSAYPSFLLIPQYIHAFDGTIAWNTVIEYDDSLSSNDVLQPTANTPSQTQFAHPSVSTTPVEHSRMDPVAWRETVVEAIHRIRAGDLEKVVLARAIDVTMPAPVDPVAVADALSPAYPECWTYLLDAMVGATPEMLVQVRNGKAMSRVLAGTISRRNDASDAARAALLTGSSKDRAEHSLAVDSVADALRLQGITVPVPEFPFVLELPNVMHLATDLHGDVPDGTTALDLAEALHPSAAVCGTPTPDAFTLIAELEKLDRGRYAGPVGWVDGRGNGEWGIALRNGIIDAQNDHRITLFAGAGIVADSSPDDELAETEAKLRPMREALGLS